MTLLAILVAFVEKRKGEAYRQSSPSYATVEGDVYSFLLPQTVLY
jgi:hypothetical protein